MLRTSRFVSSRALLAYVTTGYPYVSHTFIQDEVRALRRLGVEIATFSIWRTDASDVLSEDDRVELRNTYAIRPPRIAHFARAHLAALRTRRYAAVLRLALRRSGPGLRSTFWHLMYFVQAVVLWNECRRRGIRHLHAHFANVSSDVALLAAELGDAEGPWTWSFTMHGPTEFYDVSRFGVADKVTRADFVVCISSFCRSQLMALVGREQWGKLHVVHCGVDTERFRPNGRGGDGPVRIAQVGRLVPEKGQAVLVEAVARLRARGVDCELLLVGDGPDAAGLRGLVREHGLERAVTFAGALAHDAVRAALETVDLFCLPSFAEGVPIVLMEAMAMELPVVTTRIMGIPELVEDGVSGLLVPPGDVAALTAALARLIEDPQEGAVLAERARERVRGEFELGRSARRLRALFDDPAAPELAAIDARAPVGAQR